MFKINLMHPEPCILELEAQFKWIDTKIIDFKVI